MKPKLRLDEILVLRGLFPTRSKAQAAVMAGKVTVEGHRVDKAGTQLPETAEVEVLPNACPYVSRAGVKLEAAIHAFKILIGGRTCLDVGSSTGGFTDCMLQHGVEKVFAVDVGRGQLDLRLRSDPRVVLLEKTNARHLKPAQFTPRPDLATIDVSFISLTKVLPPVFECLKTPFEVVALIKPQFELGPKFAPKGIVRQEAHRQQAIAVVRQALAGTGIFEAGLIPAPILGAKGNQEYLWYLKGRSP
jgi:23S rRNA (cytidine1920-2'-O)/16S rRNA (cytidine1409-2'-O)-methyltransferase